jgi:hypothetical protein
VQLNGLHGVISQKMILFNMHNICRIYCACTWGIRGLPILKKALIAVLCIRHKVSVTVIRCVAVSNRKLSALWKIVEKLVIFWAVLLSGYQCFGGTFCSPLHGILKLRSFCSVLQSTAYYSQRLVNILIARQCVWYCSCNNKLML